MLTGCNIKHPSPLYKVIQNVLNRFDLYSSIDLWRLRNNEGANAWQGDRTYFFQFASQGVFDVLSNIHPDDLAPMRFQAVERLRRVVNSLVARNFRVLEVTRAYNHR